MKISPALRQALADRGVTVASIVPPANAGREEDATIRPARLVESGELAWRAVGDATPCDEPTAFLDGTQRTLYSGYLGVTPIVLVEIAAAVRERVGRELRTVIVERRKLAVGRGGVLDAIADLLAKDGYEPLLLADEEPAHPIGDRAIASVAVNRARAELEVLVGTRFREGSAAWLIVDGTLTASAAWASDPRMVSVAKSHASLPFEGDTLVRYLRLPAAHRTSIFAPASREGAAVRAWALRLWPWEDRDLFFGFVRVEVAPANGTTAIADRISQWLLAERAPISTPDPRWDRLLYGIHAVEEYLRVG